jgi:hypothetical protein
LNNGRRLATAALFAAIFFFWPHQPTMGGPAQYANNGPVYVQATVEVEIYGYGMYMFEVAGTWDLSWSDPAAAPDDHIEIETEIVQMDLLGDGIIISHNTGLPSPGQVRSVEPGIDFPAESFFDVFVEIELPGILPGEVLHNTVQDHIEGIVDDFPSFFDHYADPSPFPATPLLDDMSTEVGRFRVVEVEMTPYYPPETHVILDTMKGSDILEPCRYDENLFRAQAEVSGPYEVTSVEFSYRAAGSADPWTPFALDTDGSAESWSTVEDKGAGDGWSGYLDRWSFSPEGGSYEIQATAVTTRNGPVSGISPPVRIDPWPPFPEIVNIPADSAKTIHMDSLLVILARIWKAISVPAPVRVQVFPLAVDFKRTLTPVDQLGLSGVATKLDSMSCGPAAAASCLKYFADNGHPKLEHPGGDTSKPEQTGEQMGRELRGAMRTTASNGTSPGGMIAGIKSYLQSHGESGWTVEKTDINNYLDVGDMFDEFEADGEDVMMVVENTLPNGKTVQHCVTLGSKGSTVYEQNTPEYSAMCVSYRLDFMDPFGGEGTEQHEYNVGADAQGRPTLEGYKVDDSAPGNAVIKKFIKVSPPETGGGSRVALPGEADPGWIEIDSGIMQGGGIVDTFHWDTAGFPGGLYLLEIVAETPDGQTCRDIRLCGIPEYSVDADPPTPDTPTKLIGSYPNPFNPATTIEFYLARGTKVDLTVYDAAGREVRHLLRDKYMHGGTHQVTWNGVKDGGGRVSSGVYFYRFSADGVEMSSKLVLLR